MELKFEISGRINRPVKEVFEAVADPAKLSAYFATGGASARLAAGTTVQWSFHDCPGEFPVVVTEMVPNARIVFEWPSDEAPEPGESPRLTRVIMTFEALDDGRTRLAIAEEGWRSNEEGLRVSYGNCSGWMQMLCALKAFLEHGIILREGMYE